MTGTKLIIPTYINKKQIKGEGLNVVQMTITPEIAKFWLTSYNHSNRPITASNVAFLSDQMKNGQWVEDSGGVISFDKAGELRDGQHRLQAIVDSGMSFVFVVMVGVSEGAFRVMDTGKTRSGADTLAIEGYKNYSTLSSATTFVLKWDKGCFAEASKTDKGKGSTRISNTDISKFVSENKPAIIHAVSGAISYFQTGDRLVKITWLAGLLFIFSRTDAKLADKFIFQLATGTDIEHGSTIYWLRQKLYKDRISDTGKLPRKTKLAYIIKTWNSIRLQKPLKRLKFNPSKGERFPQIA